MFALSPRPLSPSVASAPRGVPALALALVLAFGLSGCDALRMTVDKVRMKTIGITVSDPEPESAEWVLLEAMEAARDKNEERGWERFQKVLHSSERTPNALRSWYTGAWPRMRRQVDHYDINGDGSFKMVNLKEMVRGTGGTAGYEYYITSKIKEMPTPCAVYLDEDNGNKWRIRRCSL